jgi:hypothetical protein
MEEYLASQGFFPGGLFFVDSSYNKSKEEQLVHHEATLLQVDKQLVILESL